MGPGADIIEKRVDPDSVGIIGYTSREQIVGKSFKLPILSSGEVFAPRGWPPGRKCNCPF
jgi:hypothetical protein